MAGVGDSGKSCLLLARSGLVTDGGGGGERAWVDQLSIGTGSQMRQLP